SSLHVFSRNSCRNAETSCREATRSCRSVTPPGRNLHSSCRNIKLSCRTTKPHVTSPSRSEGACITAAERFQNSTLPNYSMQIWLTIYPPHPGLSRVQEGTEP